MNGRVLVGERDLGGGFAIEARTVLTAAHVVGDPAAAGLRYRPSRDEDPVDVISADLVTEIDVALLQLSTDVSVAFRPGHASEGARFVVDASPRGNDPRLTGVLSATRWRVELQNGTPVDALQLPT